VGRTLPIERRMLAGGRLTFHHPLRIGDVIEKKSEILKVDEKQGKAADGVRDSETRSLFAARPCHLRGTGHRLHRDPEDLRSAQAGPVAG
jgi:3-methylfumaryl-CoA hydratase